MKTKHIKNVLIIFIIIFSINKTSYAIGKIVNYFLDNPNAWNDTKRITHGTPTKIVVKDGLEGLVFKLTDITQGDEVALVFLETKKVETFNNESSCDAGDKLIRGNNRIVSVITKNHGNRKEFHYKFILQRAMNRMPINIYNNGDAVLESRYDGTKPVESMSDLSGIELLEIEVR
ncbi:MAG: hypothetical protein NUV86_02260 [Candidatus Scalindua sp.]|nr:hypothetical protein [Candidatus Scalindua sp.]MCR4345015.1 hypothetical protein [Candidatus Scalindua sp.]